MAANKTVRFGPVALSATLTTNILNPGTLTGGVGMPSGSNLFFLLKHIRLVNKNSVAVSASFFIGATGANTAGTEFFGASLSVPANNYVDWWGMLRLDVADFLVGGASTATSLTFEAEGEVGVA